MKIFLPAATLLLILPGHAAAPSATIPASTGTALDGHNVTLPGDLSSPATILILGFTRGSADTTTAWEKPIRADLATTPAIGYLDMPFLEDAPAFIRPLILRSIRKQVPEVLKPRFVPLTSGEDAWKQAVYFSHDAPDAAYIVLVDRSGHIRWQTHQPFTPERLKQLAAVAHQLAATSQK